MALLAFAGTLALTDAPRYAVYQHLRLLAGEDGPPYLAWLALTIQLVFCLANRRRWIGPLRELLPGAGPLRWAVLGGLLLFAAAIPTWDAAAFALEAAGALLLMALAFANLVLVAEAVPDAARRRAATWLAERLTTRPGDVVAPRRWDALLPGAVAIWAAATGGKARGLKDHGLDEVTSTRALVYAGNLIVAGLPPVEACRAAMVNPMTDDIELSAALSEIISAHLE